MAFSDTFSKLFKPTSPLTDSELLKSSLLFAIGGGVACTGLYFAI